MLGFGARALHPLQCTLQRHRPGDRWQAFKVRFERSHGDQRARAGLAGLDLFGGDQTSEGALGDAKELRGVARRSAKWVPKLDAECVAENYHDHAVQEREHEQTDDQLEQPE